MPRRTACLLALLSSFACSSSGGDGRAPVDPGEIEYELQPWTHELSGETLVALAPIGRADGALHFAGAPEQLADLVRGDVIVAGRSDHAPLGLLRQVLEVERSGGETVVQTQPVAIQLAFKRLHARIPGVPVELGALPVRQRESPLGQSTQGLRYTASAGIGGGMALDWRVFDQDGNRATLDDQLYVHGEVTGKIAVTAYIDLDWLNESDRAAAELACALAMPICTPSLPDVVLGARAEAKAAVGLDAEGAAAKSFATGEVPIDGATFQLPPLALGPVVVAPTLEFVASIAGSANGRFHSKAGLRYEASTEISVGLKSGVDFQPPTFTQEFTPPVAEASLTSDVKVSVGPRLSLLFWDTLGPTFSLLGYGTLRVDTEADPCWGFGIGAESNVGITLAIPWSLFSLDEVGALLGLEGPLLHESFGPYPIFEKPNVLSGTCGSLPAGTYPPGEGPTDEAYVNADFTPWSRRYLDWNTRFPYDGEAADSVLRVDKSVDGGWLVSGKHIEGILKLSEEGDVRWARAIRLPDAGDEGLAFEEAESAFVRQAANTDIWVATSRLTVMQVDQDGDLRWARRYRTGDRTLDLALEPVGLVPTQDGGAFVLFAPILAGDDGPAILLRIDRDGALRWSKSIAYETKLTQARVLIGDGDEVLVGGHSWDPAFNRARVARYRSDGSEVFSRQIELSCEGEIESRVRLNSGVRLASGAFAIVGSRDVGPERPFLIQLAPGGESATVGAWKIENALFDLAFNDLAQLPVTGFFAVGTANDEESRDAMLVASLDAAGELTWQRELRMEDAGGSWSVRSGAVRLTTDGGALLFAHVADPPSNHHGIWVSKIPARTGTAAFDPGRISATDLPGVGAACSVSLSDDAPTVGEVALYEVDVTPFVALDHLAPTVESLIP